MEGAAHTFVPSAGGTLRSRLLATMATTALLCGCGGSGEGLDQNGRPLTAGGSDAPLTADFQSIQDHVFTPICAQCHAGAAAPLGFRLDEGNAYAMLVNTPSVEVPSVKRVAPGQPDASYIVQKIQGSAAVGGQMPLGQTPLPQATIDVIRQWIAAGAAPAASQVSDAALQTAGSAVALGAASAARVRLIAPVEGEVLTRANAELLFTSTTELDASTINSASVVVSRAGTPGTLATQTNIVTDARIEIRTLTPTTFAVVLPPAARLPGEYSVTVHITGGNALLDRAGQMLGSRDLILPFMLEDLP